MEIASRFNSLDYSTRDLGATARGKDGGVYREAREGKERRRKRARHFTRVSVSPRHANFHIGANTEYAPGEYRKGE